MRLRRRFYSQAFFCGAHYASLAAAMAELCKFHRRWLLGLVLLFKGRPHANGGGHAKMAKAQSKIKAVPIFEKKVNKKATYSGRYVALKPLLKRLPMLFASSNKIKIIGLHI